MASTEELEKILAAGRIAAEARDYGAALVKPGASAREVCEEVESLIRRRGAQPAFPCNFSINEVAAHYTPGVSDDVRVPDKAIVKVDVGASVDGYLADTAVSVVVGGGELERLSRSAQEALEAAAHVIGPNVRVFDIGRTIERTISSMGFRPIKNLTGHTMTRYVLHAGESIPNYADRTTFYRRLRPPLLVAIEPFSTTGKGFVVDGPQAYIYSATGREPRTASELARSVLRFVLEKFSTLPFAVRWLYPEWKESEIVSALEELTRARALVRYPVLIEASGAPVAQFEHTFYVTREGVIITTRPG
ncbi:MAG: type II methionyl aminopeptidase [Acidilobus sp.]